jgi:prolyl oligopeptidase
VKHPAVMLTHGINDPRVESWLSAKMAARLQSASASGKPVLLRIDYDAGHGIGNSRRQRNEEYADIFAFLFEQLLSKERR